MKPGIARYLKKYWIADLLTVGLVFAYPIYKHTGISESLIYLVLFVALCGWYVFQILPQKRKAAMEVAESQRVNGEELESVMSPDVGERSRKFRRLFIRFGVPVLLGFSFELGVPVYIRTDSILAALISLVLVSIVAYWYVFIFLPQQL
ncbi:MAG: hypothetical protein ABI210_15425 [Abditibacteriaceae bacterium]